MTNNRKSNIIIKSNRPFVSKQLDILSEYSTGALSTGRKSNRDKNE
jgi:hypothetical protein